MKVHVVHELLRASLFFIIIMFDRRAAVIIKAHLEGGRSTSNLNLRPGLIPGNKWSHMTVLFGQ